MKCNYRGNAMVYYQRNYGKTVKMRSAGTNLETEAAAPKWPTLI